jgi:hypothetical protein
MRKMMAKVAVGGALMVAVLGVSPAFVQPATAYPVDKLVGVAVIDDVAYLVYETPAGGFFFEEM